MLSGPILWLQTSCYKYHAFLGYMQLLGLANFAMAIYVLIVYEESSAIGLIMSGSITVFDAIISFVGALVLIFDEDYCHKFIVILSTIAECSTFKVISIVLGFFFGVQKFQDGDFTATDQIVGEALSLSSFILQVLQCHNMHHDMIITDN